MNYQERDLLQHAIHAAIKGGQEIMEVYGSEFTVEIKEDKSPLTLADKNAHKAIGSILQLTGIPVLSEEGRNIPYEERKNWNLFWLVDPLDGTKEFIKRNGEFTVNIALIREERPVMGVIFVPVTGLLYFASEGLGAFKINVKGDHSASLNELIRASEKLPLEQKAVKYTVVGSRSHLSPETQDYINALTKKEPELEFVSIGSSLKLCLVAEGKAHIYPRFGPTMEWDTAAGQAIVEIAGGRVMKADDSGPVQYNKPDLLNPFFIADREK